MSLDTDAFGIVVSSSGSTPKPTLRVPGFAGQHGYQSDATGLLRLGHRFYDASTGRFLFRDPIHDGYNWYGYCNGDPVNAVDPEGLNGFDAGEIGPRRPIPKIPLPTSPRPILPPPASPLQAGIIGLGIVALAELIV